MSRVLRLDLAPFFGDAAQLAAVNPIMVVYSNGMVFTRRLESGSKLSVAEFEGSAGFASEYRVIKLTPSGLERFLAAVEDVVPALETDGVGDTPAAVDLDVTRIVHSQVDGTEMTTYIKGAGVDPSSTGNTTEARERVEAFLENLAELESWLAAEVQIVEPTESDAFVGFAMALEVPATGAHSWPLNPIAESGEAVDVDIVLGKVGLACIALSAADVGQLIAAVAGDDGWPLWENGGQVYSVGVRPLLPDESGCQSLGSDTYDG